MFVLEDSAIDVVNEGYRAYFEMAIPTNPYMEGSYEARLWDQGLDRAMEEDFAEVTSFA